ncbi:hypothetical protein AC578_7699 [Pseudocercospora eumusae]|uniref:FHA domain-containing protein n=1 Tax=Pseudocercospora eumusae TaxID=321146 RepID=A0A139HL37_9PEZI|nr:hypothetical protein AC578_7699 [Pseudocercospora eumusae]
MDTSRSRRRYSRSKESESDSDRGNRKRRQRSPSSDRDDRSRRRRRYSDSEDERSSKKARPSSRRDDSAGEDSRRQRKGDRRSDHRRGEREDHPKEEHEDARKSSRRERERKYRDRSVSRDRTQRSHHRKRSRSPIAKRRDSGSASPRPRKSRAPLPSQDESFRGELAPGERPPEKQKPNFKPTGLLAKEANTVVGTTTVLKYHEPPEARKPSPKEQWRMFVFKKKDLLDTVQLYTRSAWLIGRDQKVTDLFLEHPSISKQHAVIQFRHRTTTNEFGDKLSKVKPYLIDLESANGTKLNGKKVETSRYLELIDGDVVSFGDSEREYVMMLPGADK